MQQNKSSLDLGIWQKHDLRQSWTIFVSTHAYINSGLYHTKERFVNIIIQAEGKFLC
jgi:hypothetical protein